MNGGGMLDGYTINRMRPDQLAAELQRVLAGPPERAAATLRAAAEGGVIQAQLVYGQWLLDGYGVAPNPAQAVQWFRYAARHSEPMALNMLGQCNAHGWGVPVNQFMAAHWYRLAAQGGLDWGMYNYATALTLGQGIAIDKPAALKWFQAAAALGHAKSLNMIGSFYEDGWVVTQDVSKAADFYLQAAEGGDFRGQFNTARLLIAQGRIDSALPWLARIPESATAAFRRKVVDWLTAAAAKQSPKIHRKLAQAALLISNASNHPARLASSTPHAQPLGWRAQKSADEPAKGRRP